MDGQILNRNIELGALVASGTTGFTMGDMRTVKAVFGVPDTVLAAVALGKKQAIQTETYNQQFIGLITAISPQADQKSRTFQVEVSVPNPKDLLKSGMVATLILGQSKLGAPLLVVPLNAIVSTVDGSKAFSVFLVQRDGDKDVARRRMVQTGSAFGNNGCDSQRAQSRRSGVIERRNTGERRPSGSYHSLMFLRIQQIPRWHTVPTPT